ncbi:MAG: serine/threonine-protein phosphatase [Planctomycetaceae bacterium]|nr:serine/threonine-protein phosphatase [Planctomycetaceae bacterium]
MTNSPPSIILSEEDLDDPRTFEFAGGIVCLYSRRSPVSDRVNEDAAAAISVCNDAGILMVADGVGGMQVGNHASAVAVETVRQNLDELSQMTEDEDLTVRLRVSILNGIETANERICSMGANAATTLCVVELNGDRIRPYHVGDSTILLCGQRGRLHWQSIAHSPLGYAVEAGVMEESDAMLHPDRHIVSNVVGCREMRIDVGPPLTMAPRDTLLLCSDGLSDNLSTEEIIQVIRHGDLTDAVRQLVAETTRRMIRTPDASDTPSKPDDLTIVAYRRLPTFAGSESVAAAVAASNDTGTKDTGSEPAPGEVSGAA